MLWPWRIAENKLLGNKSTVQILCVHSRKIITCIYLGFIFASIVYSSNLVSLSLSLSLIPSLPSSLPFFLPLHSAIFLLSFLLLFILKHLLLYKYVCRRSNMNGMAWCYLPLRGCPLNLSPSHHWHWKKTHSWYNKTYVRQSQLLGALQSVVKMVVLQSFAWQG